MKGRRLVFIFLLLSRISFLSIYAQELLVIDEQSQPLIGAAIHATDYSVLGITNRDGKFILGADLSPTIYLNISFTGYEKASLSIGEIIDQNYIVMLHPSAEVMDEVVIMGRRNIAKSRQPYQLEVIKAEQIQSTQAQTPADALVNSGTVFVQKSQMGGGSPILRGFEANRVLLVTDGVRMNNAIFRSGHLQSIITVDPMLLRNMEVIFGPNSLLYGSDALGGVIYMESKDPKFSMDEKTNISGQYQVRYASANAERRAHAHLSIANDKIGSMTSLSLTKYGDLRVGNNRTPEYPDYGKRLSYQGLDAQGNDIEINNENPNLQVGTAYNQIDVSQKFIWKLALNQSLTANFQYSNSSEIPRIDNLSEYRRGTLRWAEWSYGPQKRILSSIKYSNLNKHPFADQINFIAAHQKFSEERITRPFNVEVRNTQLEKLGVSSLTADVSKSIAKNHIIDYGVDWQYNHVNSVSTDENITTNAVTDNPLSRYANAGNVYSQLGAYLYHEYHKENSAITLSSGLRYTHVGYTLKYRNSDQIKWPNEFVSGIDGSADNLSGSIAAIFHNDNGWHSRALFSTAFRAPNIDDLSKIRINGDEITFPNVALQPEKTLNVEWTVGKEKSTGLSYSMTAYHSWLRDAIVTRPFVNPLGQSTFINFNDTLIVVANQNFEKGKIYGISALINWVFTDHWRAKATYNYTKGVLLKENEKSPLGHIPPAYGIIETEYKINDWSALMQLRYNSAKPLSLYGGGEDNPEFATPEGALAWTTWNIYLKKSILSTIDVSLSIENILDKHYRTFSSGVSGAGRNIIVAISGNF